MSWQQLSERIGIPFNFVRANLNISDKAKEYLGEFTIKKGKRTKFNIRALKYCNQRQDVQ